MKKYKLQSHLEYGWVTGHVADGRPAIVGQDGSAVLAILFSSTGERAGVVIREVPPLPESFDDNDDTNDDDDHPQTIMSRLQEELGFVEGTIEIQPFDLADHGRVLGLSRMPEELEEYLSDPSEFDDEERQELAEQVRDWKRSGDFVLRWNEDYWCGPEGIVHSH